MTLSTMIERVSGTFHLRVAGRTIKPWTALPGRRELLALTPNREDHIVLIGIFAGTGWKVRFADTLESAYAALCRNAIGVVLYGRDCSGADWRDALEVLGSAPSHPRIILLCPDKRGDDPVRANPRSLFDVITKPFFEKETIDAVERAINHPDTLLSSTSTHSEDLPD